MSITLRAVKGTPLTIAEMDANFTELDTRADRSEIYQIVYSHSTSPPVSSLFDAYVFSQSVNFVAGLAGSVARCAVSPSADVVITFKNTLEATVGTLTFTSANLNGTFSWASDRTFAATDILSFNSPADLFGMTGIFMNLVGVKV